MKNHFISYLIFGLAIGFAVLSFHEFSSYIISKNFISKSFSSILTGAVIGASLGLLLLSEKGFLHDNQSCLIRGAVFGGVFGGIGGIIGFFICEQIIQNISYFSENIIFTHLFSTLEWVILSLFIGIAFGLRDRNTRSLVRALCSSAITGVIGGIVITVIGIALQHTFLSRLIGFLFFTTLFNGLIYYTSNIQRAVWLKTLNGNLEGIDFELSQDIHFLGTQSDDDISLKSYQDIRPMHAKLVKYHSGYSLVDNDPFWQTFVNFRNIKEQPLKNGDILKIGEALFQYCSLD